MCLPGTFQKLCEKSAANEPISRDSNLFLQELQQQQRAVNNDGFMKKRLNIMLLAVAYSANIGGTGVITGTATNLVILKVGNVKEVASIGTGFDVRFVRHLGAAPRIRGQFHLVDGLCDPPDAGQYCDILALAGIWGTTSHARWKSSRRNG